VEAACVDLGRRRLLAAGTPFAAVETQVADISRLLGHVAFALFCDAGRTADVYQQLNAWDHSGDSVDLLKALNKGAHEDLEDRAGATIKATERLIELLREKLG
jgi:hypothetical protein